MISNVRFQVLGEKQIEQIMDATYRIMEEIGMDIHLDKAVELLKDEGCEVDGVRVKIPRRLTKKALSLAPKGIQMYDRNGNESMLLEGRNTYFGSGPTCCYFIDPYTNERRVPKKEDAGNTAKISDALPNMDFTMSLCVVGDQNVHLADLHELDAMIRNTTKPVATWAVNSDNLKKMIEMCEIVAGGEKELEEKPFMIIYSEPTTPLVHTKDALEKLIIAAEKNLPGIYTPGMIMGGTAPVTVAGALPVGMADTLTGLVISQLVNPGSRFISGASGTPMDMKTMQTPYGSPETSLLLAASNEVCHYLGLPSFDLAGATDSKKVDAQAGMESAMQAMVSLLSGGNLVHDCGFMDIGMTGSLTQLVVCDEIVGMAKRYCQGVLVDDDRIDIENIRQVGPGGNFLTSMHTAKYFRKEIWMPSLIERRGYEPWYDDGEKDLETKAQERVREILENHKPEELDADILEKLDEIIKEAEKLKVLQV